jgi:hypothetical protein
MCSKLNHRKLWRRVSIVLYLWQIDPITSTNCIEHYDALVHTIES